MKPKIKVIHNEFSQEQDLKLYIVTLSKIYVPFFRDQEPAVLINNTIYLKNRENTLICMRHKGKENFETYLDPERPIRAPPGPCIMSIRSPFYRTNISHASLTKPQTQDISLCRDSFSERLIKDMDTPSKQEKKVDLVFPDQLQFSYANKAIVCDINKLEYMNSSEEGRHEELHGVNLLCNPEKYVDTGYQLKQLKIEMNRALKDEVKIWTHINASVSKEFYHVYQDWEWLNTEQHNPRTYSFMGLYRKFSESDLFELMRLKQLIREGKAIQQIESDSLFATFQGNSIFSVFFRDVKIMR